MKVRGSTTYPTSATRSDEAEHSPRRKEREAPQSRRLIRSTKLIATFRDGFAAGWKMAVPEVFKAALDIRLTQRIVAKEPVMTWTQGRMFSFKEGDTLYDVPADQDWPAVLRQLRLGVQVIRATPAGYREDRFDPGAVTFVVLRPNGSKTGVTVEKEQNDDVTSAASFRQLECSQHEFVELLRTGTVKAIGHGHLDLLQMTNK